MKRSYSNKITLLMVIILSVSIISSGCSEGLSQSSSFANLSSEDTLESLPNLTICVDMQSATGEDVLDVAKNAVRDDLQFTTTIEIVPQDGGERESIITRIHTELMAGKGPDVFLFDCHYPGLHDEKSWKRLFPFIEQSFDNRLFLPLDDYIENANYIEWENLLSSVMEAGLGEEGQMVLPLGYTFITTLCPKEAMLEESSQPMAWDEMRTSKNPYILDAAGAGGRFSDLFGSLANYAEDTLLISEEELLNRAMEKMELSQANEEMHTKMDLYNNFLNINGHFMAFSGIDLSDEGSEYVMIPCYNINGGLTVNVSSGAAINRNSQYPNESFAILDYLLSKETQQNSSFYHNCVQGMPVHIELGNKNNPLQNGWYMSDANFQSFRALLSTINAVKFFSPLDTEIMKISQSMPCSETDMKKIVHKQYTTMQMMLAES